MRFTYVFLFKVHIIILVSLIFKITKIICNLNDDTLLKNTILRFNERIKLKINTSQKKVVLSYGEVFICRQLDYDCFIF